MDYSISSYMNSIVMIKCRTIKKIKIFLHFNPIYPKLFWLLQPQGGGVHTMPIPDRVPISDMFKVKDLFWKN